MLLQVNIKHQRFCASGSEQRRVPEVLCIPNEKYFTRRYFILHLGNPFGFFSCNSIFLIHRCPDEIKTLFYEEYIKSKKALLLFPFLSISQRESFTCSLPSASFAFRKTLSVCNGKSWESACTSSRLEIYHWVGVRENLQDFRLFCILFFLGLHFYVFHNVTGKYRAFLGLNNSEKVLGSLGANLSYPSCKSAAICQSMEANPEYCILQLFTNTLAHLSQPHISTCQKSIAHGGIPLQLLYCPQEPLGLMMLLLSLVKCGS